MTKQILLAASLLLATPAIFAQDGPSGGPPPPAQQGHGKQAQGPGRGQGGDMDRGDRRKDGEMRGAMGPMGGLLPPGTWWRSPEVVTRIGLTPDQVKRIDDMFLQSRMKLIDLHASLQKEQLMLEPLLNANPVDQGRALAEISKIADSRAELEKTDARMLLGIRSVLTADQWTKLQARGGRKGSRDPGGTDSPRGERSPRGQGGMPGPPPQ